MFRNICKVNREGIYGVLCQSPIGIDQVNFGTGTAFMIAPGVCATAAHALHIEGDKTKPRHQKIELIRTPDIGSQMLTAIVIAEDLDIDLALIRIEEPKNNSCLRLHSSKQDNGTSCGALGFPLASVVPMNTGISFNLSERFQGAYISSYQTNLLPNGSNLNYYETDSIMYGGSSGCPGFTIDENVFGMHIATISDGTGTNNSSRLAISIWVTSMDIINFAKLHGVSDINVA